MIPSPNGANGRDAGGHFTKGNPGGPGNPHAKRAGRLRSALLEAITPEAIRRAIDALVAEAAQGNVMAIRELLDRAVGKPIELDLIERIEALEERAVGVGP